MNLLECKIIVDGLFIKQTMLHTVIDDEMDQMGIINAALTRLVTNRYIDPIVTTCDLTLADIKTGCVYEYILQQLKPHLHQLSKALSDDGEFQFDYSWSGDVVLIIIGERHDDGDS